MTDELSFLPKVDRPERELIEAGDVDELLSAAFCAFARKEKLRTDRDAEELLAVDKLTPLQRSWLGSFVDLWDATMNCEDAANRATPAGSIGCTCGTCRICVESRASDTLRSPVEGL